jgi:flagellin-like hook-associated protein FlgL
VAVTGEIRFDAIFSGSEIFQSTDRQSTVYIGDTGARAGIGRDSGIASGQLIVRHISTSYPAGSGLAAGTDSASGDTIIGQHVLTVDSTNGTISLDGGPTVSLSPPDANLKIIGKHGDVVYVNITGLSAGFNGDVVITGSGTLSVDGGLSETAIDFSNNQIIADSRNNRVTNVDSRGISQTGVEELEYYGTSDAFRVLIDLRDELLNLRNLKKPEWVDAMNRRLGDVERVHDHLLKIVSEQAVSLENLDAVQTRAEDYQLETQRAISDAESADLIEVVSKLQAEQNQLQFVYASSARLLSISLLDFLR